MDMRTVEQRHRELVFLALMVAHWRVVYGQVRLTFAQFHPAESQ